MDVEENMQKIRILTAEYESLFYHVIFGLIFILIIVSLRKYKKFTKLYEEYPTFPLLLHLAYENILRKVPRHLSFNAYIFRKVILISKRFQKEGLFLVWVPRPCLIIYSQEAIQVFSKEPAALNKSYKYEILKDGFGLSLTTRNGDTWKKHRRMLEPVFNFVVLKNKMLIFNNRAQELVEKLEGVASETAIDVIPYINLCVMRLFFESILDLDADTIGNEHTVSEISQLAKDLSKLTVYRFFHPWLHSKFMLHFIPTGRKYLKMYDKSTNLFSEITLMMEKSFVSRKTVKDEDKSSNSEFGLQKKSFTHILFEHLHQDSSFTMEMIRNEAINFMAAGYDTVSHAILWSMFLLGHHPDVQDKAYNEVESIWEGSIRHEDLHKLKYLECVIKESLRLYPPVPLYARNIDKDIQCGKYMVPKGTDIVFFSYMLHRNPEMYSDPDTFDPDRFFYSEATKPNQSLTFIPFSEGIRDCIGKRFAMIAMKVFLAHIIRKFRIASLDKPEDIDLCWEIVLRPEKPLKIQLSLRK